MSDGTVGSALAHLLDDVLPAERARKNSIEARALAVISSSGTLVTLLLALGAVVTRVTGLQPSLFAIVMLGMSAGLFTIAAGLAIYCNVPGGYYEIEPHSLLTMTRPDVWDKDGSGARRELAIARIEVVRDWRRMNERKARVLAVAAATEVVGVLTTTVAVVIVLVDAR